MTSYANRLVTTVSAVASTGLGAFTISAASSGYRSFLAADDGKTFDVVIAEGSAWEVRTGCVYTHTGTTLSRGTLEASSTGSAVAFTVAAVLTVTPTAASFEAFAALNPIGLTYGTTIAFTQSGEMPLQTVSGPIAFTASTTNARAGVTVSVDLRANGTNVPTFSGFREWDGSSGYVNTSNVRNCITFFYRGGTAYYSINQQFGAAADPTPATAVTMTGPASGRVSAASTNFTVGANGTITGTIVVTPSDSAGGGTFTPTTVSISAATPTATFTYTAASVGAKTISATNNGGLTNPSNITYTPFAFVRYNSASAVGPIAEAGDATVGYTYTTTSGGLDTNGFVAVTTPKVPDLAWVAIQGDGTADLGILGLSVSATPVPYNHATTPYKAAVWVAGGNWYRMTNGAAVTNTTVAAANGTYARLRRSGTDVIAELSTDNGVTWPTTLYTWTGLIASTDVLYAQFGVSVTPTGKVIKPIQAGMTA